MTGIPIPIPQTSLPTPGIGAGGPNGAVGAPGKATDGEAFRAKMEAPATGQPNPTTEAANPTNSANSANSTNSANKTDAVTNRNEVPNAEGLIKSTEERNMGKLIDRNRQIWEKKLEAGEISEDNHQLQTWRLMGVQQRVQEIHMRVEMVTKVVDHGTQSVKQLSQTQA